MEVNIVSHNYDFLSEAWRRKFLITKSGSTATSWHFLSMVEMGRPISLKAKLLANAAVNVSNYHFWHVIKLHTDEEFIHLCRNEVAVGRWRAVALFSHLLLGDARREVSQATSLDISGSYSLHQDFEGDYEIKCHATNASWRRFVATETIYRYTL